jgi:hypothetical protein
MRRLLLILLMACSLNAYAGRGCEVKPTQAVNFIAAMELAEKTRVTLDASGAQVVLLSRVGQDLSKYGLRYSHMGYARRDAASGHWTVVHELNECGTARSALYEQGLGNFFLDDLFAFEANILVPSKRSQTRIAAMLNSGTPLRLHRARYNMLSYAFSTEYQNSNQWVLETYAASVSDLQIGDRAQAQAWLKLAGYRPRTVQVGAGARLGARLFSANIAFDDHPFGRRAMGMIDTVVVESVLSFVKLRESGAREILVR